MTLSTPATSAGTGADVVRTRLRGTSSDVAGAVFKGALVAALGLTIVILFVLVADVVAGGWSVFAERGVDFLSASIRSRPDEAGVAQAVRGSFWIGVFVVVLTFPIGIGAAVYLEEYAPKQSRVTRFFDVNIRNLAGVPSVVYGLLGLAIFVQALDRVTGGSTLMAAGMTLAVLVLPIVIITSSEAIRAVPDSIREAGFGVGATRWEVVRNHVLPYAAPGVLTGTVLALARALGEAAPLILVGAVTGRLATGGASVFDVTQLQERFTALPIVITHWAVQPEAGFRDSLAPAAIVVLLVIVLLANTAAIVLRNRYEKKR